VDFWEASMDTTIHSTSWKNTKGIAKMLKKFFSVESSYLAAA
jgi:hypothetical protein